MIQPRIIPALLLKDKGLVKGSRFKNYVYVGDPINAVRIFNEKKVDELLFLDIMATNRGYMTSLELIRQIADECYMPFGIGGGISEISQIKDLITAGAEKICINSALIENPELISEASNMFGAQSVMVSIDVKKNWSGRLQAVSHSGKKKSGLNPVKLAVKAEKLGAGEILLTSIDHEGTRQGYDLKLIESITDAVKIPVIASGGAGKLEHFKEAVEIGGASAVSAGSMFVFHGKRDAVLINYPFEEDLKNIFGKEN